MPAALAEPATFTGLSEAEGSRASGEVKVLRNEGYGEDRADAVAPARPTAKHAARERVTYAADLELREPLAIPTRYRAERRLDGTVSIPGVPLFAESSRVFGGKRLTYDARRLRALVAADRHRRATGYRAPMHFGHHGLVAGDRDRAGHFELDAVRLCLYDGRPSWILFGTLVFADEDRLRRALREYPHRSAEISFEAPDEVNSLALLSSEAPYFRFPNLEHASFHALAGGGAAYVWRQPFMEAKDAEIKPEAKPEAPAKETPDLARFMESIDAKFSQIVAYLAKLSEAEATEAAMTAPAAPPMATSGHVPIVAAQAQLEGRLAATEAELAKVRQERNGDALYARLLPELAPYSLPNGERDLRAHVAAGTAEAWVAGIRSFAPPTARPREQAPQERPVEDPKEVAAYAAEPERLEKARYLYSVYQAAGPKSIVRRHPVATFLAANLEV